jgi:NAD(P)-dependent dehydrogenase (short-subunit alcohol dehydrogenase family)
MRNEVAVLDGKVALVTGASRGIGAAIAERLAGAGAAVAVVARSTGSSAGSDLGTIDDTVSRIRTAGGTAVPVQADVSHAEDRERAVAEAVAELGAVDILVNNAAATFVSPVVDFLDKRYRLMFELQVHGPFHFCQLVLPSMCERGAGWIVNISSRAAQHPVGPPFGSLARRGFTVYGMCKSALERMSTGLAAEVTHLGVRVNALAPWDNVATPGTQHHNLTGYPLEDAGLMAEAALLLSHGDLSGQIAYSTPLLIEHEARLS